MPSRASVQGRRHKRKEGKLKRATDTDQTTRRGAGSDLKGAFASSSFFCPSWIGPIGDSRSSKPPVADHTRRTDGGRQTATPHDTGAAVKKAQTAPAAGAPLEGEVGPNYFGPVVEGRDHQLVVVVLWWSVRPGTGRLWVRSLARSYQRL